ncbi:hypothetical protein [Mycobacterium sp. RTGN5]|uniref:hypothetical protein n=1 Tax=Mycobacterium sp. RTGN5 TaxID=3016522 RepID=UPI0029C7370D|nr:hypothetical protein [Mycobacterium sp. RTGN5]
MPMLQACLAGIATSVLAAGVVTANSDATPQPSIPTRPNIELAASTFPIIDFTGKLGPLSVTRKLTLGLNVPPNLLAGLLGQADTAWNASIGPTGEVKNSFLLPITLAQTAPIVDLGFEPQWKSSVVVSPLGAAGPTIDLAPDLKSKIHLIEYRGGPDGYGFGINGTLLEAGLQGGATSPATMLGGSATLGEYKAQFSVIPFTGLKAALSFSPYSGGGGASIQLGTLKLGTTLPSGQMKFDSQLCLGSAAASCGGVIAQVSLSAMLGGTALAINGTDAIAYDFPDSLKIEIKAGSLAITGNIGGTVTIGTAKVGGVIPINIQIPPPPAVAAVSALRKTQTAAAQDSAKSVPAPSATTSRKSATTKRTGSATSGKSAAKQGTKASRQARG